MNLGSRISRLEAYEEEASLDWRSWPAEDLFDDQLARLIMGQPGAKAADLSDEYLKSVIGGKNR